MPYTKQAFYIPQMLLRITGEEAKDESVNSIRMEHSRMTRQWMNLHYYILAGGTACTLVLEIIMYFVLSEMGMIQTTAERYLIKYVTVPLVLNGGCIIISGLFLLFSHKENRKAYVLSLSIVMFCFCTYSVHKLFLPLMSIFVIPVVLTVIYENMKLTTLTTGIAILAELFASLFVKWDPTATDFLRDTEVQLDLFFSIQLLLIFYCICLVIIYYQRKKTRAAIETKLERYQLILDSYRDPMTALFNRKALRQVFDDLEMTDNDSQFCFAMLDIDNFKNVNDTMGHVMGDEALIELGRLLNLHLSNAIVFRMGGDEYSVLMENVSEILLREEMNRVRTGLAAFARKKLTCPLTVSMGVATYEKNMEISRLIKQADSALYEAKKEKDEIVFYNGEVL